MSNTSTDNEGEGEGCYLCLREDTNNPKYVLIGKIGNFRKKALKKIFIMHNEDHFNRCFAIKHIFDLRKVGTVICERCALAHHCQDHADRHSNLTHCFPVRVESSASKGRHLVATR